MQEIESLLIVMVVVFVMGRIFRTLKLPVLFGELLGGILIGPLVFGIIDPQSETIKILAELGVFFLMLHAGLETEPDRIAHSSKKSVLIAIGGFAVPFLSGFFVSKFFGMNLEQSLFVATGISATAIAISVRIFKDCKLQNTKVANTVLSAAIISDIIVLIVFSMIVQLFESGNVEWGTVAIMLLKIILFFTVIIWSGIKLEKYSRRFFGDKGFTFTLIVALSFGLFAELIGLHLIIGAFLAGLFIREEHLKEKVFKKIEDRIYGLSYGFLGPIFFLSLAFNLDIKGIITEPWLFIGLFLTAFIGKFMGATLMGIFQRLGKTTSVIIGIAMNSRGVVDLIIASLGYQIGIIDKEVFSILVVIALASTLVAIFAMKPFIKLKLIK